MDARSKIRDCPYCKEEIKAEATRCKHCRSELPPEKAPHGGICPYCKEKIQPEAIKCKHCGSSVGPDSGCEGCAGAKVAGPIPAEFMRTAAVSAGQTGGIGVGPNNPNATALGVGCGACQVSRFDPFSGVGHGSRFCSGFVPVVRPNGTIGYEYRFWWEDCIGFFPVLRPPM
jgi:Double zinc ribbon